MFVINDPLGQTHIPNSSDHYFQATFCDSFKVETEGRTDGQHVWK